MMDVRKERFSGRENEKWPDIDLDHQTQGYEPLECYLPLYLIATALGTMVFLSVAHLMEKFSRLA